MKLEKLRKLQISGDNYSKHFKEVAKQIVMDEVTNTDDENKETIAMFTARDMAIGALLKRDEYTLQGMAIGILGTALTIGIYNKIKKDVEKEIQQEAIDGIVEDIREFNDQTKDGWDNVNLKI